jgi:protein tyrosine phosphatase
MMFSMQSTALGSAPLKVTQYHFTGWPDHGVPQNGVTLINFIKRVRTAHPYSDSRPLLVHCSAGVGRTGAFIVLDSMLRRMEAEENLNIYEFFKQLRAQRVLMVQTQVLCHKKHDMHSLHAYVVLITLCIPFSQRLSSSFLQYYDRIVACMYACI